MEMQPGEIGSLSGPDLNKVREGLIVEQLRPRGTAFDARILPNSSEQALPLSGRPANGSSANRRSSCGPADLSAFRISSRSRYIQIKLIRMALEGLAAELAAENVDGVRDRSIGRCARHVRGKRKGWRFRSCSGSKTGHSAWRLPAIENAGAHRADRKYVVSMGPILNVYYREIPHEYVGAEGTTIFWMHSDPATRRSAREGVENDIKRAASEASCDISRNGGAYLSSARLLPSAV